MQCERNGGDAQDDGFERLQHQVEHRPRPFTHRVDRLDIEFVDPARHVMRQRHGDGRRALDARAGSIEGRLGIVDEGGDLCQEEAEGDENEEEGEEVLREPGEGEVCARAEVRLEDALARLCLWGERELPWVGLQWRVARHGGAAGANLGNVKQAQKVGSRPALRRDGRKRRSSFSFEVESRA